VLARQVVAGSGGAARLAPPSDLDQLAAIFRRAALVVTNDTGPMHLAVACGAAVLALLLSRDGARWSHRGPAFAGVPVSADGGGREAGASDELEQVAAAARSLLAARGVDAARAPASR
jgi:ADP-heptose:LPS heptosyltransferase